MSRFRLASVVLVTLTVVLAAYAVAEVAHPPAGHVVLNPADIVWKDAPPVLPKGAKVAVLRGDPAQEGIFTMRLKLPDGYRIAPHWHPAWENVTVLSGTFWIGSGERFDTSQGQALRAGGFTAMPPKMAHFAWVEGETEVQLTAFGPWQLYYVNPADDPSRSAAGN
jgi:hypothetical protein